MAPRPVQIPRLWLTASVIYELEQTCTRRLGKMEV